MRALVLVVTLLVLVTPPVAADPTTQVQPTLTGPATVEAGVASTFSGYISLRATHGDEGAIVWSPVAFLPVDIVTSSGAVVARTSTNYLGFYYASVVLPTVGSETLTAVALRGSAVAGRSEPLPVLVAKRPGAPTDLAAVEARTDWITLTWTPPEDTGGLPLGHYRLYRGDNGGPLFANGNVVPNATSVEVLVPNNTDVRFELRATNAVGEGAPATVSLLRKVHAVVVTDIVGFVVCRSGAGCTDVAPGGTYQGAPGDYSVWVRVTGGATRAGEPLPNVPWRVDVVDLFRGGSLPTWATGRTGADGTFVADVGKYTLRYSGCFATSTWSFRATTAIDGSSAVDEASFVWRFC